MSQRRGIKYAQEEKKLLIIGVVLFFGAAVCFGISQWYYRLGGSVMDGPGDFYAETFRMYSLFLRLAEGLIVAGAGAIAVDLLVRFRRRK